MALPLKPDPAEGSVLGPEVNILLVDDEVRNLDALEGFLESPDYRLVRVVSGDQALLQLLNRDFTCIVLDVQMPNMSGIELANIIKQRRRTQDIPIIFLTAYLHDDKEVLQGYDIGAVDFLTKPINPNILKSKIGVFVDLYRKTRALARANQQLEAEIKQRQQAEEDLRQANLDLESRVSQRTADLVRANQELRDQGVALRQSEAHATAASRAKDDFLATLSHELRTPLNPVLLLASEAALNEALAPDTRADFETIARNVSLEARLIDDMLDLTRIARGKISLDCQKLDLHEAVKGALGMAREEIEKKGINLSVDLSAGRSCVLGDDVRLKQVFWNVIKNAGKFTPENGRIEIVSSHDAELNEVAVRVSDSGIGMTAEELLRIFEPFSQGDHAAGATAHRFGGIGLGLAISRKMVDLHGGRIEATSPGRGLGTTFTVRLPAHSGSVAKELPKRAGSHRFAAQSSEGSSGVFGRILLVEDHQPTSVALTRLLVRRNFSVVAATSVQQAVALAEAERFDLLISDIGLPDGTGLELMQQLKRSSDIPGIALSGYGMEDDLQRSISAGYRAHLTKPIGVQALEDALAIVFKSPATPA